MSRFWVGDKPGADTLAALVPKTVQRKLDTRRRSRSPRKEPPKKPAGPPGGPAGFFGGSLRGERERRRVSSLRWTVSGTSAASVSAFGLSPTQKRDIGLFVGASREQLLLLTQCVFHVR